MRSGNYTAFAACSLLAGMSLFAIVPDGSARSSSQDKFRVPCHLPFERLAEHQTIDSDCPIDGLDTDQSETPEQRRAHLLQNVAKNNFCATGTPIPITVQLLASLQYRTEQLLNSNHIPWGGRDRLPPDRSVLREGIRFPNGVTLAEGTVVVVEAYVLNARHSNVSKGESVNCNLKKAANNDIHIALASRRGVDPCYSMTAEISPHWRPESWDTFDSYEFSAPVRIIGPLFFDASHRPCQLDPSDGHPIVRTATPARLSNWEIHPVYSIQALYNGRWIPFDQWVKTPDNEDQ